MGWWVGLVFCAKHKRVKADIFITVENGIAAGLLNNATLAALLQGRYCGNGFVCLAKVLQAC